MSADQVSTNPASPSVQKPAEATPDAAPPAPKKRGWIATIGLGFLGLLVLLGLSAVVLKVIYKDLTIGHTDKGTPPSVPETADKPLDAIHKGVAYLQLNQEEDGNFSRGLLDPKPAMTAMVVEALAGGNLGYSSNDEFMQKAIKAILAEQKEDGAIVKYGFQSQLGNYITCICVNALAALKDPRYQPNLDKARDYLRSLQRKKVEGDPNSGGVGYGGPGKVDGNNAAAWVEAMHNAGVKSDDPAMKNAKEFFDRLSNNTEINPPNPEFDWEPNNDGSFMYRYGSATEGVPDETSRTGKRMPRGYGMRSYNGLKTFLILDIPKDDTRIRKAMEWIKANYTLDENRNVGKKGLFYTYLIMAKALALNGDRILQVTASDAPGGPGPKDWAKDMTERLLKLQKADGSWRNDWNSGWMEDDPILVTAYAVRTLIVCREFMQSHPLPDEKPTAPPANVTPKMKQAPAKSEK